MNRGSSRTVYMASYRSHTCMCTRAYVCAYICKGMHAHIIYTYTYVYTCICADAHRHTYTYTDTHIHILPIYSCPHMYAYDGRCACIHTHTHTKKVFSFCVAGCSGIAFRFRCAYMTDLGSWRPHAVSQILERNIQGIPVFVWHGLVSVFLSSQRHDRSAWVLVAQWLISL